MTQQERMDLLSREVLTVKDLSKLLGVQHSKAGDIMRAIKVTHDRLGISTVVHIQDYIEYFNLPVDRYIVTVVAERDKDDKIQFYKKGTSGSGSTKGEKYE